MSLFMDVHTIADGVTEADVVEAHKADLELKVGLHKGHSIAVTLNDRVDYFGQTVNIAARTQQLAVAGEIYITSDVYEAPGVSALLDDYEVSSTTGTMAGVTEEIPLFRIMIGKRAD